MRHRLVRWEEKRISHISSSTKWGTSRMLQGWWTTLTDAVLAFQVEHVAHFAEAPVTSFGVEAFCVLADPRQEALVDVCEMGTTVVEKLNAQRIKCMLFNTHTHMLRETSLTSPSSFCCVLEIQSSGHRGKSGMFQITILLGDFPFDCPTRLMASLANVSKWKS